MQDVLGDAAEQVRSVVDIAGSLFGGDLRAVYLHGSAVSGGLRPQSDLDLLAVIDHPMTARQRDHFLVALSRLSGRHPARPGGPRCIEVMVFLKSALAVPAYPARAEFIYGEWLRDAFETGDVPMPVADPELSLVLAQARHGARALLGPPASALLPEIPADHIRRAMRDMLPALVSRLQGDERNVLLTLARMWRTARTGEFVTKDAAAVWAAARLPAALMPVLLHACEAYLGRAEDHWQDRQAEAGQLMDYLHQRVSELL